MRRRNRDRDRFVVAVLWMRGWPVSAISAWYGLTSGAVRGLVHRLPDPPRSALSVAARQAVLDRLKADRADDGLLDDNDFIAADLERDQIKQHGRAGVERRRATKAVAGGKATTGAAPRDVAGSSREPPDGKRRSAYAGEGAEAPVPTLSGRALAPLEYLEARHILADRPPKDAGKQQLAFADGAERRRLIAARRIRDTFEGAEVSSLRSVDLMIAARGGPGIRPTSDFMLDCQRELRRLDNAMPVGLMSLLEDVVHHDRFVWRGLGTVSKRRRVYDDIKRALDLACWCYGMVGGDDVDRRWPESFAGQIAERMRPFVHQARVERR